MGNILKSILFIDIFIAMYKKNYDTILIIIKLYIYSCMQLIQ
ncbi:hypothetical protein Vpar_1565 [Veillonella parvula DSM 2008]|nr:hypothetical protein Vpar_1565 [Veillonella parvula DSM 2008]SNV01184.1 Uncharacterised protein [Veillonella parvula]